MFCSNCGQPIPDGARFCPNCGQEVVGNVSAIVNPAIVGTEYQIVLLSAGSCNLTTAREIISDLLGYTDAQATELLRMAPVEIACKLNAEQAMAISQALTELGLQVSIRNEAGYVDFNHSATNSIFSDTGTVLQSVMNVLGTLTLANRVRKITRWTLDDPFRFIFAPRYRRPAPPRYMRNFRRKPVIVHRAPRTVPRPAGGLRPIVRPAAAPKPALRPAPRPAVRPAAAPRPTARPAVGPVARPAVRPAAAPKPAARPASGVRPSGPVVKGPNRGPSGAGRGGRGPGRP